MDKEQVLELNGKELYDKVFEYFNIKELVSKEVYDRFKDSGKYYVISRFDPRLLQTVLFIRTQRDLSMIINNWAWGGNLDERGLRTNVSDIVKRKTSQGHPYISGHPLSCAVDFNIKGETAEETREWLQTIEDNLPFKIRLEHHLNGEVISWVHLDVINQPKNPKVYLFDV